MSTFTEIAILANGNAQAFFNHTGRVVTVASDDETIGALKLRVQQMRDTELAEAAAREAQQEPNE